MLLARTLLLRLICATRDEMRRVRAIADDSSEAIDLDPDPTSRTMRYALMRNPPIYDDDDAGCLRALKLVSKGFQGLRTL